MRTRLALMLSLFVFLPLLASATEKVPLDAAMADGVETKWIDGNWKDVCLGCPGDAAGIQALKEIRAQEKVYKAAKAAGDWRLARQNASRTYVKMWIDLRLARMAKNEALEFKGKVLAHVDRDKVQESLVLYKKAIATAEKARKVAPENVEELNKTIDEANKGLDQAKDSIQYLTDEVLNGPFDEKGDLIRKVKAKKAKVIHVPMRKSQVSGAKKAKGRLVPKRAETRSGGSAPDKRKERP